MSESRTRHFIADRRLAQALDKKDGGSQMEAVRELLDEAWNKGFSAGRMRERMNNDVDHCSIF